VPVGSYAELRGYSVRLGCRCKFTQETRLSLFLETAPAGSGSEMMRGSYTKKGTPFASSPDPRCWSCGAGAYWTLGTELDCDWRCWQSEIHRFRGSGMVNTGLWLGEMDRRFGPACDMPSLHSSNRTTFTWGNRKPFGLRLMRGSEPKSSAHSAGGSAGFNHPGDESPVDRPGRLVEHSRDRRAPSTSLTRMRVLRRNSSNGGQPWQTARSAI